MKEQMPQQDMGISISPTKPSCNSTIGLFRKIRRNVGASLEYLWELSGSMRLYNVDVVIVTGKEKYTNQFIKVFYIGHYDNYAFIFEEMFSEFKVIEKFTNINSMHTKRWLKKYQDSVDLLFVDIELLFCKMLPRRDFIVSPQWIRQKLEIPDTWEGVLKKFRKNTKNTDLRKVRKYHFSYRITRSEEDFKDFYHRMYRPYLKKRFGNAVIIEPEWKVIRQCRKGELMHIIRENEVVAGVLLHKLAGRLAYVWVGVPENIQGEMYKGAFSALYYFTIVYGYENGCHEIDFLGSRPLLNDGLFRYKRKWGTYVQDSPIPRGDILLKPLRFDAPVRNLFSKNYFIARDGKGLVGKILFHQFKIPRKELEHITSNYFTEGLRCLKIYSLLGFEDDAKAWAKLQGSQIKIFDLSQSLNPADAFCRL